VEYIKAMKRVKELSTAPDGKDRILAMSAEDMADILHGLLDGGLQTVNVNSTGLEDCSGCSSCTDCTSCRNSIFCDRCFGCVRCRNLTMCIGCIGLQNRHGHVFNVEFTVQEFDALLTRVTGVAA
jgi:hypothetical protein